MKRIIEVLMVCFFLISSNAINAQEYKKMAKLSYTAGYPIRDVRQYIEGKLFDGIQIEGKYFLNENISIGLSTGWNSFSDRYDRKVYYDQYGEISAVQTRFFRSIPLLFAAHYYLANEESKVRPYVGLGLGGYQMRYEKWYGVFAEGKEKWSPGVRPEAGVLIPLGEQFGVDFNLKYNYAVYSFNEIKNFHFAEASIGVFLKIY